MVICTIADIKTAIYTSTVTDLELTAIVTKAYNRVLRLTGVSDDSNPSIQEAIEYTACAMTLRRMKTTGEQAASVKTGNDSQQNTADKDISIYDQMANELIAPFVKIKNSQYSTYSSPSCHQGFENYSGGRH